MSRLTQGVLLAGALATVSTHATGQDLLAYDGFDYGVAAGSESLHARDGGFGWSGGWVGIDHTDALASFWPFDSSPWDAGPLAAHGTLMGGAFDPESPPGMFWSTGSLRLTRAQTEYVDLTPHLSSFAGLMRGTISVWIKPSSNLAMTILSASDSTESINDLSLRISNSRAVFTVRGELLSNVSITSASSVIDGDWHHIAVTVAPDGAATLYVDGIDEGSARTGFFGHVLGIDQMSVGRNWITANPTQYFDGLIDELTIWGNVLDEGEVQMIAGLETIPLLVPGAPVTNGPNLETDSLSPAGTPHVSFESQGLSSLGNRARDESGNRAARRLLTPIDLGVDADYYLSCLIRRSDLSGPAAAEVLLADDSAVRVRFGWDAAGSWTAGMDTSNVGAVATNNAAFFAVLKIAARASSDDQVFLRTFRSQQPVPTSETGLVWDISSPTVTASNELDQLWLQSGATSAIEIDELRIGTSWASVTRLGYGTGCLGPVIGKTNRAALGSSDFSIDLASAPASAAAFVLIGSAPANIDLGLVGGTGCTLLTSGEFAFPTATDATGAASLVLPIPNDAKFYGISLFAQWAVSDFTNPLPLAFSDGLQIPIER